MKLYYVPGACSLATHIALIEMGASYRLVAVGRDKRTDDGRDFATINPKGYVPALELDDGSVLTESPVILNFLADRFGALLQPEGLARWRTLEAIAFMASELHGSFKLFFYPDTTPAEKDKAARALVRRFGTLADQIADQRFLGGNEMTIADPYLFVMLTWATLHGIEVPQRLHDYAGRMRQIPSVARALAEEGLSA